MRKLFFITFFLLISGALNLFAQTSSNDLRKLKQEINLPENEAILVNENLELPAAQDLKVLLAINQSRTDAENFGKWITKWNKKNGSKYRELELVNETSAADLIVVQFRNTHPKYAAQSKIDILNIPLSGNQNGNLKVNSENGYERLDLPIFSYLLLRSNGIWTVIYQHIETSIPGRQLSMPDAKIRTALSSRLKNK